MVHSWCSRRRGPVLKAWKGCWIHAARQPFAALACVRVEQSVTPGVGTMVSSVCVCLRGVAVCASLGVQAGGCTPVRGLATRYPALLLV